MTDTHLVIDFDTAAEIALNHQHRNIKGCSCGWSDIGKSWTHDHFLPLLADAGTTTTLIGDQVVPPTVNMLGEIAEQLSRVAGALASPPPTITEEQVAAAWSKVVRMFDEKAVPFLEELGIEVEQEPKRRVI